MQESTVKTEALTKELSALVARASALRNERPRRLEAIATVERKIDLLKRRLGHGIPAMSGVAA